MSPLSMRQLAAESSTCQAIILNQQRYQHAKKTDTTPRRGQFSFYDGAGFVIIERNINWYVYAAVAGHQI